METGLHGWVKKMTWKPTAQQLATFISLVSLGLAIGLWQGLIISFMSFFLLFLAFTGGYVQGYVTYTKDGFKIINEAQNATKPNKPNTKTKTNKKD